MGDGITVTITGMDELKAAFEAAEEAVKGEMLSNAAMAGALLVQNAAKEYSPKKTRNLSRSIHSEIVKTEERYAEVAVGTDLEYAAMQEFGGTIVPKNVSYLAIPLTAAAEACVSPRGFSGPLRPVFFGMEGMLVDAAGEAQYALKKSVTIPAHPYLRPALDEQAEPAKEAMGKALAKLLEAVK